MPQENNYSSNSVILASPCKNLRGLKGLVPNNDPFANTDEIINDYELAHRKAEEAASRRYQAAAWLRKMDYGASETLSKEPSEEEFRLSLRNGLILCNVLNKVNPGAVLKVVENPIIAVQSTEGAAQSAIQYFENMRNFLEAVKDMKLLTFEASDLEKGGSSSKVVDCILCLKGYYEWKQAGGIGVWRYGGTVRITCFPKGSSSSLGGSESADESIDESESSQFEQLLEFLHLSSDVSVEESRTASALAFLFDRFGLGLLQAYLHETNGIEDFPLNEMVVDTLLSKVVKDFSALLVSQGTQLGLFLKKLLRGDTGALSKSEFLEAISKYLAQRSSLVSSDLSKFCICGGNREALSRSSSHSYGNKELIDIQNKQLEELKSSFQATTLEVKHAHSNWEEELRRLELHIKGLEVTSSSYNKVLEENRYLYNQVQDLKGTIRVYCRVRPCLPGQSNVQSSVDYIGENGTIMIVNPLKQGKDSRRVFTFNKVFRANVTQEQIYVDTQPLIRSVLDGYNSCIFAYGQTGSGKTYTMSGPDLTTEETWGVNYRALRDLFQMSKARKDVIRYEVAVQMIEIYNEQVRDLLVSDGATRRLDIRNKSQLNGLNVPDASLIPVTCTRDVLELMKVGHRNRAVGATALNERSSRSHSVLTIHVLGKELASGSILRGCLHLVDLAGSERVDKSEATGERLKEAQYINRSLSALGDVISALAQKSAHVPYRNSKLTQVLQDSLGGQAKTMMFVHINPELNALGETISTLKFAERVASIELGAARSNKETGEIREMREEISNLKLALEKKEAELEMIKGGTRSTSDTQKSRAVSPFRIPRGINNSSKPEACQRPLDDTKITEARSCSSGKQRRLRFPSAFNEKEIIPKIPFLTEETSVISGRHISPSPPIRRSISTDRGAVMRGRIKPDTFENLPIVKIPLSARVQVNKSLASTPPAIPPMDNNLKVFISSQEHRKREDISDALYNVQKAKKVYPENEDEQFKQALNVRQGGIRKGKNETKAKMKQNRIPARLPKYDAGTALSSDFNGVERVEEARRSDFLEPENEHIPINSPMYNSLMVKKLHQNSSRNYVNLAPRGPVQAAEPLVTEKTENKFPNGGARHQKDGSNMSMPELRRSRSTPREPPSTEKVCQDQETADNAAPQSAVTYVYQAKLAELCCNVTAIWCKNLTNHSLCIAVAKPCQENYHYICNVDLNSCQLWGKKGLKSFDIDGRRVDVYWDFRQATFSGNPEPCSDYYVALVSKAEVVLLLGDLNTDAYDRTRSKPVLEEAKLLYKKENVHGKRLFCTKAMLEVGKQEHDIVIETSLPVTTDPDMWITVDGTLAKRIMNLNWRFRGNESLMFNDFPVEIFWDVHDWLFSDQRTGEGLFIFKPGRPDWKSSYRDPGSGNSSQCFDSPIESLSSTEFCHFLYALKTE